MQLYASDGMLVTIGQVSGSQIYITGLACTKNQSVSIVLPTLRIPLASGGEKNVIFHCPISSTSLGAPFTGYLWIRYNTPTYQNQIAEVAYVTSSITNINSSIYASNLFSPQFYQNELYVVNVVTHQVTQTLSGYNGPTNVYVSPNQTVFLVANANNGTISIVNTTSFKKVGLITGFDTPYGVVQSTTNQYIYVANEGNSTISIYDPINNSKVGTITGLDCPIGIVLSPYQPQIFALNGAL